MPDFNTFIEPTPTNTHIVQRALRQVDTAVLATAMIGLDEAQRDVFYRNVSQRVEKMLKGEIEQKGASAAEEQVEDAKALVLDTLIRVSERVDPNEVQQTVSLPDVNVGTAEEIVDTFRDIGGYIRRAGFLALQGLEDKTEDPMMRKSIEYLVDGVEPMLMRSLLEKYKTTLIRDIEARYDMIIDGADTMVTSNMPQLVEIRLRTHIPS